jgi:hypothetical protein
MTRGEPRAKAVVVNRPMLMISTGNNTASLKANSFFNPTQITLLTFCSSLLNEHDWHKVLVIDHASFQSFFLWEMLNFEFITFLRS